MNPFLEAGLCVGVEPRRLDDRFLEILGRFERPNDTHIAFPIPGVFYCVLE